jgi:hypothetical protein
VTGDLKPISAHTNAGAPCLGEVPAYGRMLSFKPLLPADFPLLLAWLSCPHVKEWWDDGVTLEKVALNYWQRAEDHHEERFIRLKSAVP